MLRSLFNKSRAQINRENARKSTGPKTPAGKASSSRNALKEGFSASFAIVAPEDQQCYDGFLVNLRVELHPQGVHEEDLFRRISLASWNIRRIEKLTLALYEEQGLDPLASDDPAIVAKLERYTRHQTLNERSYCRGVKQLRLLQNDRAANAQPAPPSPLPDLEQTGGQPVAEPPAGCPNSAANPNLEAHDSKCDKTKPDLKPESPPLQTSRRTTLPRNRNLKSPTPAIIPTGSTWFSAESTTPEDPSSSSAHPEPARGHTTRR
ncbi:MAG: hypothetical protein LC126_16525 [Bryobacterales bacterium]|nr:hypothetical protein [Bryobacterales bacterium]